MRTLQILLIIAIVSCAGPTGSPGPQGTRGTAGEPGPAGNAGATGQNGTNGSDGSNGSNGIDGINGTDATPVTIIQFCPSQGPTTYGHFPEQGLCIGNKIYGVYYDTHNAFLAEIVPGNYVSTSTGLQCNFTITTGCEVLQ